MKNKLTDLNNHLFAQLERLGEEGLEGDRLSAEIDRTKAITDVSKQVISNAALALKAEKLKHEHQIENTPEMIGSTDQKKAIGGPCGI